MSKITNVLLTILFTLSVAEISSARPTSPREDTVLITFRFQPREDLFTLMGNEAALNRLYAFLDKYRAKITEDKISIRGQLLYLTANGKREPEYRFYTGKPGKI